MYLTSMFRRKRSDTLPYSLTFLRSMGGGPRTFPGGLNKWQWKRLHEKKAREKEKRLLEHEKQIYQARIRSEIRARIASSENPSSQNPDKSQNNYSPLSPQDHIKALADRFMKEGAEDLWNEADGPTKAELPKPVKSQVIGEPIDLRKFISENSNRKSDGNGVDDNLQSSGTLSKFRSFSTYSQAGTVLSRELTSGYPRKLYNGFGLLGYHKNGLLVDSNSLLNPKRYYAVDSRGKTRSNRFNGSSCGMGNTASSTSGTRVKWPRFRGSLLESSDDDSDDYDDDDEEEEEEIRGKENAKRVMSSSAALGKHDVKTTKRIPLNLVEKEYDLSAHVDAIRKEFNKRKLEEDAGKQVDEESILSSKRFDECDISPLTVQALTNAGYLQMTRVQEAVFSSCLDGKDALVKARTGTGKSIAFLLPAIETVLKASSSKTNQRVPPIYVLILCPTRELASQIAAEANVLLKYHNDIGVKTLIGGTRFKFDQLQLESGPCQIVVATPGRLLDHIENKSGLSVRLMGLKMLILDEADRLLDLGFRKEIEKIVDCLPRQRQSLLFSATVPKEVRRISQLVLDRDHAYINTVGLGCLETHPKVKQFYLCAPHEEHFQLLYHLLKSHISQVPDYKVIVFCTTAMMTSLMFSLFHEMKMNVREIHSRKPQLARTRISDEFKGSKELILFTSDVSARGMDYPDVTLVIQVGIPPDRAQYIHRLGRTGRQGKEGEGILLLAPWEEYFMDDVKDLPLKKFPLPHLDPDVKVKMEDAMRKVDTGIKEATYHAWLGYYNSINAIGRDKTSLVELANRFSESVGLEKPPSLYRKTALKMGLKDIPGIRIRK